MANVATLQYIPVDPEALPTFDGQHPLPSPERLQQIRLQLAYLASRLQMLSEEMGMYLPGDSLPEEIEGLGIDVHGIADRVQEAVREIEDRTTEYNSIESQNP